MSNRDLAVLREIIGDGESLTHELGGVASGDDRQMLHWLMQNYDGRGSFLQTSEGRELASSVFDRAVSDAARGESDLASYLVGLTDSEIAAGEFDYYAEILTRVENNTAGIEGCDAPCTVAVFGDPNMGKTGHVWGDWFEAFRRIYPHGRVVTNADVDVADFVFTGLSELYEYLVDNPDVPKFLFLDEANHHLDAHTNSYEVSSQWMPLHKRFAKLGVQFCGACAHSGMDIAPEYKRLTGTFVEKTSLKSVQFYDSMDDGEFQDPVFSSPVDGLEAPRVEYDPDDWSPLRFDLDPDRLAAAHG